MPNREKWRKNYIPYFGFLSLKYARGMNDAYDIIFDRFVRMKGILWDDEVRYFKELFEKKHPEIKSKRAYKNRDENFLGACWNYKWNRSMPLFGRDGLFRETPITPKPEKRNKVFLEATEREIYRIQRGYKQCN
ncbi:MAG: hypothetical protein KGI54_15110 [Pseudomonadota bacterium]|nr:hypothetical protein [Pseudomonadota bacterium]